MSLYDLADELSHKELYEFSKNLKIDKRLYGDIVLEEQSFDMIVKEIISQNAESFIVLIPNSFRDLVEHIRTVNKVNDWIFVFTKYTNNFVVFNREKSFQFKCV